MAFYLNTEKKDVTSKKLIRATLHNIYAIDCINWNFLHWKSTCYSIKLKQHKPSQALLFEIAFSLKEYD